MECPECGNELNSKGHCTNVLCNYNKSPNTLTVLGKEYPYEQLSGSVRVSANINGELQSLVLRGYGYCKKAEMVINNDTPNGDIQMKLFTTVDNEFLVEDKVLRGTYEVLVIAKIESIFVFDFGNGLVMDYYSEGAAKVLYNKCKGELRTLFISRMNDLKTRRFGEFSAIVEDELAEKLLGYKVDSVYVDSLKMTYEFCELDNKKIIVLTRGAKGYIYVATVTRENPFKVISYCD